MTSPLSRIKGQKKFTLTFPTVKLLKDFGLPLLERDIEPYDLPPHDLTDVVGLDVRRDAEDRLVDAQGKILSPDAVDSVQNAVYDATMAGTEAEIAKRILATLERILETFSDYRYEYPFLTDEAQSHASGRARGILTVDVGPTVTKLVVADDIVHVIHHNIAGIGMFHVTDNFEGEKLRDFVRSRFHWLHHHWEIHGGRAPEPDLDRVDFEFDDNYFRALLKDIEKEYGLKLHHESRRR